MGKAVIATVRAAPHRFERRAAIWLSLFARRQFPVPQWTA